MKFFIDTASPQDVALAMSWGFCDGVTTNPSLVAQTGRDYRSVVRDICNICPGPVSAEVLAMDFDGIMNEARKIREIAKNVIIKIPLTENGIRAVKVCSEEGIQTNVTLCFSPLQALVAAKAGATYISPFVGRLDDCTSEGMQVVKEICTIYKNYELSTQVLVASVRSLLHLKQAALLGAHVATIPLSVFKQILKHPLTDRGLEIFNEDAKKIPSS
jgi:transaldolase